MKRPLLNVSSAVAFTLVMSATTFVSVPLRAATVPSARLEDYAVFATDLLRTRGAFTVGGLGVGVNRGSILTHGPLSATDQDVVAGGTSGLVRLRSGSTCRTLFASPGKVIGTSCSSSPVAAFVSPIVGDVPSACGYPVSFPVCGGADVIVGHGQTRALTPGTYGKIILRGGAPGPSTLSLAAGDYTFCTLRVGRASTMETAEGARLFVSGDVQLFPDSRVEPTSPGGSPFGAFVSGQSVRFSRRSQVTGRVCAPNALLALGSNARVTGSVVARVISVDRGATVEGIPVAPSTTTSTLPPTTTSTVPPTTTSTAPVGTTTTTTLPGTTTTSTAPVATTTTSTLPGTTTTTLPTTTTSTVPAATTTTSTAPVATTTTSTVPGPSTTTSTLPPPPTTTTTLVPTTTSTAPVPTTTTSTLPPTTTTTVSPTTTSTTVPGAVCGDGIQEGDEECDVVPAIPQICTAQCKWVPAVCGDGVRQNGETCDDGNTVDGDACPSNCVINTCAPTQTKVQATISYAKQTSVSVGSVVTLLDYPDGTVTIPGIGGAASVGARIAVVPTGFSKTANDLDYALRVLISSATGAVLTPGQTYRVSFDLCFNKTPPPATAFTCQVLQAATSGSPSQDIDLGTNPMSCSVTIP